MANNYSTSFTIYGWRWMRQRRRTTCLQILTTRHLVGEKRHWWRRTDVITGVLRSEWCQSPISILHIGLQSKAPCLHVRLQTLETIPFRGGDVKTPVVIGRMQDRAVHSRVPTIIHDVRSVRRRSAFITPPPARICRRLVDWKNITATSLDYVAASSAKRVDSFLCPRVLLVLERQGSQRCRSPCPKKVPPYSWR